MKYSDTYSISLMCKCLHVSRASFYHYFYYSNSNDNHVDLLCKILSIYYDSKCTYGAPRIAAVLSKEGLDISIKTVGKYMNILDIHSISKEKYPKKNSTMNKEEKAKIINRIKGLDIYKPNQVWTTDITYIKTVSGWVYLSSIMDLYSRKIIAWNVGLSMTKELVIETLNNAFKSRGFPTNVIVHSDKGAQYRSHAFRALLAKHNCLFSYTSLNHFCDENANQESFHATLKKESLYNYSFYDIDDVKRACFEFIEGFYNPKRLHSSLGYVSPDDFETNYFNSIPLFPLSNILT